ncbi:porin [Hymenobacter psychrotolerans]|uniref:Putative beta-barrel porin-2, OmpL-like. bbp2 n=1 Tax=Hymenobacter psychrotolerans DSM 18569 TaxID=1121959 RepID=A0A1M7F7A5_9BACT|nr:porin [Hymenobacter psychrotolerans]SHL99853.1 Putative beta-barrel porin-2, OmpL-like. bbp2 [Hymenobacter psychrotolerans DSM 18569]
MKPLFLLATAALLTASAASAQTTPDSTAAPVPPTNPLTTYGFVDGYYGYDFKHAATNQRPGFLYSHNRQNEFTVNNAIIGLRYDNGQVRGALGLHAGTYVSANYAAEDQVLKHFYEVYAGFRPFRKAWLDVGIFGSHIGFESAMSKDNWTLTRSLMAENSPYYEAGARFTYEVSPKLTLTGLVLNGWQNIRENNQAKALGTQIQWKPTDKLLINSSTFYGNEQPQDSVRRRRYFHDFYVSYAATDRLSLALVFDVGKQESERRGGRADTWHTGAAFVRYKLTDKWTAAARAEYYSADRGVIISTISPVAAATDFKVQAASLNLDYAPTSNMTFRVEGRTFHGRQPFLTDRNGNPTRNYGNMTSSVAISF